MILVSLAPTERPVAGYGGGVLRREGAKVNHRIGQCNGMYSLAVVWGQRVMRCTLWEGRGAGDETHAFRRPLWERIGKTVTAKMAEASARPVGAKHPPPTGRVLAGGFGPPARRGNGIA